MHLHDVRRLQPLNNRVSALSAAVLALVPSADHLYIGDHAVVGGGVVTSWPGVLGSTLVPAQSATLAKNGSLVQGSQSSSWARLQCADTSLAVYVVAVAKIDSVPVADFVAAVEFAEPASADRHVFTGLNGASTWYGNYTHYVNGSLATTIPTSLSVVEALGVSAVRSTLGVMGSYTDLPSRNWIGQLGFLLISPVAPSDLSRTALVSALRDYYGI